MSRLGSRVRAAINPLSTAVTQWWCHSALRYGLTGYGPKAEHERVVRPWTHQGAGHAPSAERMKARFSGELSNARRSALIASRRARTPVGSHHARGVHRREPAREA